MTKPDKEAAINKAIEEMIITGTGVIVVGEDGFKSVPQDLRLLGDEDDE